MRTIDSTFKHNDHAGFVILAPGYPLIIITEPVEYYEV